MQKERPEYKIHRIRQRLGSAAVADAVAAYRTGSSIQDLATTHNTSHQAMWSLLKEEGVAMRYQSLLPHQVQQVLELYEAGLSIYAVAEKLDIPKTTVGRTLKKEGVLMRGRGGRQAL